MERSLSVMVSKAEPSAPTAIPTGLAFVIPTEAVMSSRPSVASGGICYIALLFIERGMENRSC